MEIINLNPRSAVKEYLETVSLAEYERENLHAG
jgi:hypothetical protein